VAASGPVTPGSAASPDPSATPLAATQLAESGSSAPTAVVLLAVALLLTGAVVLTLARRHSRHGEAA
jgi:mannose/fructose/N-acetylgalactosamine-specific phosphotransferase system component IIC